MPYGSRSARMVPLPPNWATEIRPAVLERDGACQWKISHDGTLCGSTRDLEVDHIGDPAIHDLANLRALCRPHHRARSSQQGGRAAAARRAPRRRQPERHPGLV
jgi:5-methylcytosine-specific restriction protein A